MNHLHSVSIQIVLFSVIDGALVVCLHNATLPSGILMHDDTFDGAVSNILADIGLSTTDGFIEQLHTVIHEQTSHDVSIVYYMLLSEGKVSKNVRTQWIIVDSVSSTHQDQQTITYAIQRLRWKIEYTNIVYSLLPVNFTLSQLQHVYEAILGKQLDKRNFRKKILSLGMLRDTGKKKQLGRARPAAVYSFIHRNISFVEIL